jgi:hypothetical protein
MQRHGHTIKDTIQPFGGRPDLRIPRREQDCVTVDRRHLVYVKYKWRVWNVLCKGRSSARASFYDRGNLTPFVRQRERQRAPYPARTNNAYSLHWFKIQSREQDEK